MSRGEGTPLQSRKFIAFLVAEVTWKILAALVLFWGKDAIPLQVWAILLAIVLVAGFVEVGYIVGQAYLDKYLRIAQIAVEAGQSIQMKGVTMTPVAPKTPEVPEAEKPGEDG
jgi:hypothetical protein